MIKEPKTESGTRIIPMISRLRQILEPLRSNPRHYVVSGKDPLQEYEYAKLYKNYMHRHGITATAHQIRHSFATRMNESGIDGKAAQEILGHAQLSTTMDIYTDFRKKSLDGVKTALDETF